MAVRDAGQSTVAAPERSLGLAGSIVKGRYLVKALSSVRRDVVVYRAEDVRSGRPITLEVLRDELAGDAEFVAAVRDQAWTLATSAHAHRGVARVYDCGTTDTGELFVALERTEGPTLREVLDARGALDPGTALRVASELGEALEALHHHGSIHGQLDPDSVLMVTDDNGRDHVTLVGVELTAGYRTAAGRRLRAASPPPYLAPEQIERGETTDATDVYALGMLLREMLTADKAGSTNGARRATPVVPPTIERIVATALDARPHHRYPDISVMINDMWGAQTVFAEPETRPRVVKHRTNGHRRMRPRRAHFALGIATVVASAIIGAAIVWAALSDRIIPRFRAGAATPAATAVPLDKAPMPAASAPSSSAAAEGRATRVESGAVTDAATVERLARPIAEPRPAPAMLKKQPAQAAVVDSRLRRPVESPAPAERPASQAPAERPAKQDPPQRDLGDGSAIIDWLLKERR